MNCSERTRMEELKRKKIKIRDINYKFNIFEVICASFFNCCMPENLERKNNINEKANDIIFKKLDLVLYVRNMILLDIMNEFMLDDNKKNIVNLLCRPVISLNKDEKYKTLQFYKNYKKSDFDRLYDSVNEILQKQKKGMDEKKLISFSNEELKDLL